MTKQQNHKTTSIALLMGTPVVDTTGSAVGHVREFAVAPSVNASHVYGLVLKLVSGKRGDRPSFVHVKELRRTPSGAIQIREGAGPLPLSDDETYLLLERDLLDQQIIDVHGRKVVRVNDVNLAWEAIDETSAETNRTGCRIPRSARIQRSRLLAVQARMTSRVHQTAISVSP